MTTGIGCFVSLQREIIFLALGEEKKEEAAFHLFLLKFLWILQNRYIIYRSGGGEATQHLHYQWDRLEKKYY